VALAVPVELRRLRPTPLAAPVVAAGMVAQTGTVALEATVALDGRQPLPPLLAATVATVAPVVRVV